MSEELWEYANRLSESGDPDSQPVRGFAQRHEEDEAFQDLVGRINSLHEFQQDAVKSEKKPARRRRKTS